MAYEMEIHGEDELWDLLERFLRNAQQEFAIAQDIRVIGWSPRLLFFPDDPLGHSISPSVARAISGFHSSVCRAYAYLSYGRPNATVLRTDDIRILDFKMLVISGSNGIELPGKSIEQIVKGILGKMSSKQITISVIVFLLLFFSTPLVAQWIQNAYEAKRRDRESAARVELSEQETKRAQIMAEALNKRPDLRPLAGLSSDSREALIKGIPPSVTRAQVVGAPITPDEAQVILSRPRERGAGRRLDGTFQVTEVGIDNPDGFVGRLKDVTSGQEFSFEINWSDVTQEDVDAIFRSAREKTPIKAYVNAWFGGDGKVVRAMVVRASEG